MLVAECILECDIKEAKSGNAVTEIHPDDPILTTPIVRYNAMLAVLGNTLYM